MLIVVANDPGLAREPTCESKSSTERSRKKRAVNVRPERVQVGEPSWTLVPLPLRSAMQL
jgi:hypothetical protein